MYERHSSVRRGSDLGVELGGDVGGVAEDGGDHGPLQRQLGDDQGGGEEAGKDERGVDDDTGPQTQVVHGVDGGLQL